MKKVLLIVLFICVSMASYGQIISINNPANPESSYTPDKLVEDLLVSTKCTAVNAISFQVSGDPTDIYSKSYGYFKKPPGMAN